MIRRDIACMGTGFTFQILDSLDSAEADRLLLAASEVLEDANLRFSLYRDDSEISQLVRGKVDWPEASAQALAVRDACLDWQSKTGGFFDARSGSDYDPSGYVKAWATRNAADYLQANGVRQFTINAGGDVLLSQDLQDPILERVGISNLKELGTKGAGANFVLDLAGTAFRAVATSGVSERGEHIWRQPGERVLQATVAGYDLITADVWATALVSGGRAAWEAFLRESRAVGMMIFEDYSMIASPGFYSLLGNI